MEITYHRKLHKSYMCIETVEDVVEEHELMILKEYKVPQLLPMQMMIQDGKVQYWFEITGKQQLEDYLGGRLIGMEQLRKILCSLEQLCQKMPEFLLKEERICLESELLYVDLSEETVYFAYLPFWKEEFPEAFRRWMEEVLKKIDHQDRACVEQAYHIYEKSRGENVSIRELLGAGQWNAQPSFKIDCSETSEKEFAEVEEESVKTKITDVGEKKSVLEEKLNSVKKETKEQLECIFSKIPKKQRKKIQSSRLEKQKMTLEPEIEIEKNMTAHTELLCADREMVKGRLVYQGGNDCADFWIETEEFLIGRNSEQVDGKIQTDGISRIHAKITKREGEYYIEDLNSTNGTYLNGELLEYHCARKLTPNDWVRFGIEEYVFC